MNYKKARGYLSPDERQLLFDLAKEATTILNVGVEYGASIHALVEGSKPHTKIIAIDLIGADKFEGKLDCEIVYLDEYNIVSHLEQGIDLIKDALEAHSQKTLVFIAGNSNTIPLETKADLIFIDGGHWSPVIENDIAKYSQLATKYLLFHDYSDSPIHAGVKQALDNWNCEDFQKIKQVDTIAVYKRVKAL